MRCRPLRLALLVFLLPAAAACGGDSPPEDIVFAQPGSVAGAGGKGTFRFGASTAATQIEDQNPSVDWYAWTAPAPEGLGKGVFVADASKGFSMALDDVSLITALNLDVYRFSVEWARVEPQKDVIDESALQHYDAFIDALVAAGVTPAITVHHFSSPTWVDDPRLSAACSGGPTDAHMCGWTDAGAEQVIQQIAAHAKLLAERYGDRVDDWLTVNEPINYLIASYGLGQFPPGRNLLLPDFEEFMAVMRNYVRAHVAIYDAIKEGDTVDADGDGVAAHVGFTLNVNEWTPARDNQVSTDPEDVAATDRVRAAYHYVFVDSLLNGTFDGDLDGTPDETHADWTGKLDWLGVQYYARIGVTGERKLIPGVEALVCVGPFDLGSCLPPADPTHWVPSMRYEYFAEGLYNVLADFGARWPNLPMTVTESGLATNVGRRRAEHVVRSLEQIHRAIEEGSDVRGYYHWSLYDNFEWAEGYEPRFGLYTVDFSTYARTPTEGADVLSQIAGARTLSSALRESHGGVGPMTPETEE